MFLSTIKDGDDIYVKIKSVDCGEISNTIEITINPIPVLTLSRVSPNTCAQSIVTYNASASTLPASAADEPYDFFVSHNSFAQKGSDSTISFMLDNSISTTLGFSYEDINGCTASISETILIDELPDITFLNDDDNADPVVAVYEKDCGTTSTKKIIFDSTKERIAFGGGYI